ncbi:MAG: primosomal protein N' [Alphaproteobacteria bacterium]
MEIFIEVVLPLINTNSFSYKTSLSDIEIGNYVRVPFRNKETIGIVWSINSHIETPVDKIKTVIDKVEIPLIQHSFYEFLNWIAKYSMYPLGSIMKMVLPINLEGKIEIKYLYKLTGFFLEAKLTSQRKKLIDILQDKLLSIEELTTSDFNKDFINKMYKLNFIEKIPIKSIQKKIHLTNFPPLSEVQQNAVNFIKHTISEYSHKTILLEGITGSGKTEVYFSIIKEMLETSNSQILILLPEIVLATQLIERFIKRFGFKPCVWHSSITDKERRNAWHGIVNGDVQLIIGARSALFLPFNNLALIIVDEEHESSYKQEEGVIYNARDMAVARGAKEKIPVILASATPSLETILNTQNNKYIKINLPSRYSQVALPETEIVDMREEELVKNHWLSNTLKENIISTLDQGYQAMLFLNRRGYAPLTLCKACGFRYTCINCSTWLVEHKAKNKLECHHCGYFVRKQNICPNCTNEDSFIACGPGVERIEEEVKNLIPNANIAVMTKDTLSDISKARTLIQDIENNKYNIIIGTQIIAKGLHFPKLTLVGIIDADLGLAGGDLRASEKNFQLLSQLSGRAGREKIRGKVIIQTYNIGNPIIQALKTNNQEEFLKVEIENRKESMMPPFSKLAAIILSGADESKVKYYSYLLVKNAPGTKDVKVLGPTPAILSKLRNKYRYRILVKANRNINIQNYLNHWFKNFKLSSSIKLKIDIDPYNFY